MLSRVPAGTSKENITGPSPLQSVKDTDPDIPDGGVVAWCTVFGAFLANFCGMGYASSFGVFQAFYARQYLQNESASATSWIGSLSTFLITALGPISGPLFDHEYFYHVYITGAVLISLSAFMLSLAQSGKYYQFLLVQGLASGIGRGLMLVPSLAIISHHFKRRRTAMLSIVVSAVPLGGILHSIMLNKLLNSSLGFTTSMQISAIFVTALLILSCALVRTRYSAVGRKSTPVDTWNSTKKCFTEVPSLLTIIGFMLFQTAYFYPFFYFQMDSLEHGLGSSFSFYSVVIMNAVNFIGRVGIGTLLSCLELGIIDLTIMSTISCGILMIGIIWLHSVTSVVVIGALYGFSSGIGIAMMAPMLGLGSNPAELGMKTGVGFAILGIGALVGSPISGALLTRKYHWWAPGLFCGAIMFASALLFIGVRFSFARRCACAGAVQMSESDENKEVVHGGGINFVFT